MKTVTKIIYAAFALLALAIGALTVNAAPGDLFEADYNGGTINKFTPDGARSTFATGLVGPRGLAFDSAGNLFAGNYLGGTIYKFTPDGTRSTFASGLNFPTGLAFDTAGNLFEAAYSSGTINKFTPDGTQSTFASGLSAPQGLAFDSAGNLFEADSGSGTIYKFAPDGTRSTFASGLSLPIGLAFDSAGNLFEADSGSGTIYKFAPDGTRSTFASGLFPVDIQGLAFDSTGNLFVADYTGGTIYKFVPDGTQSTFASALGGLFFLAIQPAPLISHAAQIQQPINSDGTSVFNVKRGVVPVKFTLTQGGVSTCDLPPATIAVTRTGGGVIGQVNESLYSGNADSGSNFRIDNCQYVYNLNSRALGVGIYRVDVLISAQVVGSAAFELR